jgi:hypothetical protein
VVAICARPRLTPRSTDQRRTFRDAPTVIWPRRGQRDRVIPVGRVPFCSGARVPVGRWAIVDRWLSRAGRAVLAPLGLGEVAGGDPACGPRPVRWIHVPEQRCALLFGLGKRSPLEVGLGFAALLTKTVPRPEGPSGSLRISSTRGLNFGSFVPVARNAKTSSIGRLITTEPLNCPGLMTRWLTPAGHQMAHPGRQS